MQTKLQIKIAPMWSVISDVKERIKVAMQGYEQGEIDFSIMVSSELLENAIKYGVENEKISTIGFDFEISQKQILITVANGINIGNEFDLFINMMAKIRSAENKKDLYIERLQEILEDPSQSGSHLGLYRIVSEGEFELDCEFDDNVLKMIAKKTLKEK